MSAPRATEKEAKLKEKKKQRAEEIPLSAIRMEEGAEELLKSPEAQSYIRLAVAIQARQDPKPALLEISQMPLEKRYLWRVVSALKWAFADFDDLSAAVDCKTLSREDLDKIESLLQKRPLQFCLLLKALYGSEKMERIMSNAIEEAKELPVVTL